MDMISARVSNHVHLVNPVKISHKQGTAQECLDF